MKYRLAGIFLILSLVTEFSSCSDADHSDYVFCQKEIQTPEGWKYGDPVKCCFLVSDTIRARSMYIMAEVDKSFPYRNIYTQMNLITPSHKEFERLVSIELLDSKGYWKGECKKYRCKVDQLLADAFRLDEVGQYCIWFEQYSRDSLLPGIRNIGFQIK